MNFKLVNTSLLVWSILVCSTGCSNRHYVGSTEYALEKASNNQKELNKVLEHFHNEPEKLEAAKFLISGMPFHGTKNGEILKQYYYFYKLFEKLGKPAIAIVDSLQSANGEFSSDQLSWDPDLLSIDAEYIIHNIELAFKIRNSTPWGKNISFENFCKYVLPYRLKNEELSNWRDSVLIAYKPLLDSLSSIKELTDPLDAARIILEKWNQKEFQWTGQLPQGPGLGVSTVFDKAGTCLEFAHGLVYLLRSFGIPAGIDMVNIRGENNSKHFWPFTLDGNGNTYVACTEIPAWNEAKFFDISAAKIFRSDFCINYDYYDIPGDVSEKPIMFALPIISDVTRIYKPNNCFNISFDNISNDANNSPMLLAISKHNRWEPIDITNYGQIVTFQNVAGGVIAILGRWSNNRFKPVSNPFEIDKDSGNIRFITKSDSLWDMSIFAKMNINMRNSDFVERLLGGTIEGANNRNFSDAFTIHIITEYPKRRFNRIILDKPTNPIRFVRYRGADSTYCNIAELACFCSVLDSIPVKGKPFGTPGDKDGDGSHEFYKAFDGDPLTSFNYKDPSGGWTAIDFGKPISLQKFIVTGRNRDNYIRKGDCYELFYYDHKWISCGKTVAKSDSLLYKNVPANTLYYLKNHTRGREERIFEYDYLNKIQLFW